jgi:hypothetical protein
MSLFEVRHFMIRILLLTLLKKILININITGDVYKFNSKTIY